MLARSSRSRFLFISHSSPSRQARHHTELPTPHPLSNMVLAGHMFRLPRPRLSQWGPHTKAVRRRPLLVAHHAGRSSSPTTPAFRLGLGSPLFSWTHMLEDKDHNDAATVDGRSPQHHRGAQRPRLEHAEADVRLAARRLVGGRPSSQSARRCEIDGCNVFHLGGGRVCNFY
jgi:hypothetical protein